MSDRISVVFGDVHGEVELLEKLVKTVHDRYGSSNVDWYSVGDLVDRGLNSKAVVDLCAHLGVRATMGNHETWPHMYLSSGNFDEFALHKAMGGKATLESYGCMWTGKAQVEKHLADAIPKLHKEFILSMPLWFSIRSGGRTYRLTHTGLDRPTHEIFAEQIEESRKRGIRGLPELGTEDHADLILDMIEEVQPAILVWAGCSVWKPDFANFGDGSCQIFGHTPCGKRPLVTKDWIALDTGCGTHPPHTLSCIVLPTMDVIQVNHLTDKVDGGTVRDFDLD